MGSCDWIVHTCCAAKVMVLERHATSDVTIRRLQWSVLHGPTTNVN